LYGFRLSLVNETETHKIHESNKDSEEGSRKTKKVARGLSKEYKTVKRNNGEQSFKTKIPPAKHRFHSRNTHFDCHNCGKTFKQKYKLRVHMVTHSKEKPFECPICNRRFKRKQHVVKHDLVVHQGKKYDLSKRYGCSHCLKAFNSVAALESHQYVHTGMKKYKCSICGTALCNQYNLSKHMKTHEDKSGSPKKPSFQCHICGASFIHSQSHSTHLKTIHGDGKPKCPICGKILCDKRFLATHMNSHTGEKPFCCEHCGKSFASKRYLTNHVRCHTGESPFVCFACPKAFKQRSNLTRHYKSKHPSLNPRAYTQNM
jgi:Zinc finger, C2H2 type.